MSRLSSTTRTRGGIRPGRSALRPASTLASTLSLCGTTSAATSAATSRESASRPRAAGSFQRHRRCRSARRCPAGPRPGGPARRAPLPRARRPPRGCRRGGRRARGRCAGPSPVPPILRVELPSSWWKRSKTSSRRSGSMPGPLSATSRWPAVTCLAARPVPQLEADRTVGRRELERVRQQVQENLLDPHGIDLRLHRTGRRPHGERHGAVERQRLEVVGHEADQMAEVELRIVEVELGRLDLRGLQEVVDMPQQHAGRCAGSPRVRGGDDRPLAGRPASARRERE